MTLNNFGAEGLEGSQGHGVVARLAQRAAGMRGGSVPQPDGNYADYFSMTSSKGASLPIALSIAGSDSGGGAGIQADLKTFAALRVHGLSALTCLTAQNPSRVKGVYPVTPSFLLSQLEALFEELPPHAVKTGMLFSKSVIQAVSRFLVAHKHIPVVVDPVMISTSGATLLKPSAINAIRNNLFPRATLITPNLHEAEHLLETKIRNLDDLRKAAAVAHQRWSTSVLLKGGHLQDQKSAIDVLVVSGKEKLVSAPFIPGMNTHGTGCTYSAAIAAELAKGHTLIQSVVRAKSYISNAIARSRRIGKHWVLGFT